MCGYATQANRKVQRKCISTLVEVNFRLAILNRTDLSNLDLRGIGANLAQANLYRAIMPPRWLESAKVCNTTLPSGNVSNRDCNT
jgi:uncharacterized protein YjbI with pentapeptide repeats